MEEIEIVKLLLLKKKLQVIVKNIDSILLSLDIIERFSRSVEIEEISSNISSIDFALDEMIKKIQKEI